MQWREMTEADMPQVIALAAIIHVDHPEDDDVITERRTFFPETCLVLESGSAIYGYTLVHPAGFEKPPALNRLVGSPPEATDTLHIHDIALAHQARGSGAAQKALNLIEKKAKSAGYKRLSIVAVNGTEPFWQKQDFRHHTSETLTKKLASYDGSSSYMIRDL
ncbi:GNAT family N-acetyltransferase [Kordiimonas sp.]|uniref:GNAT family N-acetyltransferase n=1 Tax=Kordiimonas sp. TaxID=1970157 RepID=UPI003A8D1B02